jgi:hypothetical protein
LEETAMNDLLELGGVTTKYFAPTQLPPAQYGVTLWSEIPPPDYSRPVMQVVMPATSAVLDLSGQTSPWVIDVVKQLEKLGRLQHNWDSYGGLPLSPQAKAVTFDALGWLKNKDLPTPAVILGSGGAVHLEWRSKGRELEVGFSPTATIEYAKVDSQGQIEEGEADVELRQKLNTLATWLLTG